MKRIDTIQQTFEAGMIEGVKQDINSEANSNLSSVLWLENYNPNMEFKSLVKRYGIETFNGFLSNWSGQKDNIFLLSDYAMHLLQRYAWGQSDYQRYNNAFMGIISHAMQIETSNPNYHKSYVIFARRQHINMDTVSIEDYLVEDALNNHANSSPIYKILKLGHNVDFDYLNNNIDYNEGFEATAVIADVLLSENKGNQQTHVFGEVYSHMINRSNNLDFYPNGKCDNPGWYTFGTFQDASKFGETIIFVTKTIEPLHHGITKFQYLSYVWRYFDIFGIVKNREGWLWGFELSTLMQNHFLWDDKIYSGWKVKYPSHLINDINAFNDVIINNYSISGFVESGDLSEDITTPFQLLCRDNKWALQTTDFTFGLSSPEVPSVASYEKDWTGLAHTTGQVTSPPVATKNYDYVYLHNYWDYLAGENPRGFFKGEYVPYLITIKTRQGTEIILGTGTYRIGDSFSSDLACELNTSGVMGTILTAKGNEIRNRADTIGLREECTPYKRIIAPVYYIGTSGIGMTEAACYKWKQYTPVFRLRITKVGFDILNELDAVSLKFYTIKGDSVNHIISRIGGPDDTIENTGLKWSKPQDVLDKSTGKPDYSKYALIREWKIQSTVREETFREYKKAGVYANDVYYARTNNWTQELTGKFRKTDGTLEPNEEFWYSDEAALYDYPDAETLVLGYSGELCDAVGAKCICVIKGMPFVAGIMAKTGNEEQAFVRHGLIQNGSISTDMYAKEDYLKVGHLPITALFEFREQLLVFNRECHYRIMLPVITDVSTWEFLEVQFGQGTFSSKTICNTPYGYVYCNENGIWISDGAKSECLTGGQENISDIHSLYQRLAINNTWNFTDLVNPGGVSVENGYNVYMELTYDISTDELLLCTPVKSTATADDTVLWTEFDKNIRLIYNFKNHNWRIESIDALGYTTTDDITIQGYKLDTYSKHIIASSIGRMNIPTSSGIECLSQIAIKNNPNSPLTDCAEKYDISFMFIRNSINRFTDLFNWLGAAISRYKGKLITHELGDGIKDSLLHSVKVECVPYTDENALSWDTYNYLDVNDPFYLKDPVLAYELRNVDYINKTFSKDSDIIYDETIIDGQGNTGFINNTKWYDLIYRNMLAKGDPVNKKNPFLTEMQAGSDDESYNGLTTNTPARESLTMFTPLNTKFRHMRWLWESYLVVKIKGFWFRYYSFHRRNQ